MSRAPKKRFPVLVRGTYDIEGAAQYLSVSSRKVRELIDAGHLTSYIPLGMTQGMHITREELDRYIEASAHAGAPVLQEVGRAS